MRPTALLTLALCLAAPPTAAQSWPTVDDEDLARDLADPWLVPYTRESMPPAYQFWAGLQNDGIKDSRYNMGPPGADPTGNYFEFPWRDPAGTTPGERRVEVRRAFLLPPRTDGGEGRWPAVYWSERNELPAVVVNPRMPRLAWSFPRDTLFVELLSWEGVPFLLRTKRRELEDWQPDEFAPFVVAGELQGALARAGAAPATGRVVVANFEDVRHPRRAIRERAEVELLPELPRELRARLIAGRTWQSTMGRDWRPGIRASAGGLAPAGFAAVFEVEASSCGRCHESAGRSVAYFEAGRDWYGAVSGDDRILSWHPYAAESIATRGEARPVRLRPELLRLGLLEPYDPQRHPGDRYRRLDER